MNTFNVQLNTVAKINRFIVIKMTSEATRVTKEQKPHGDGSASFKNVMIGYWRVHVYHESMTFPVYDRRVLVNRQRNSLPIFIPEAMFSNNPLADPVEENISDEQGRLAEAASQADEQGFKAGGQPIFADDWNAMAGVVAEVARSTNDLSAKLSPIGHSHPEYIGKFDEFQEKFEQLFEVFGKAISDLQRQIQILALEQSVNNALDQMSDDENKGRRDRADDALKDLGKASKDKPGSYSRALKRAAEELVDCLYEGAEKNPEVGKQDDFMEAIARATAASRINPANKYLTEVANHNKINDEKPSNYATGK